MSETRGVNKWTEELASLVQDTGIRYAADPIGISTPEFGTVRSEYFSGDGELDQRESLKDQAKGFVIAWGDILLELGRGCRDVVRQSLITEDSYLAQKLGGPCKKVAGRLRFLNEYLPEDRDPVHAWSVIFFVFILALAAISMNTGHDRLVQPVRRVRTHPTGASRILLPDGRHMAYCVQGVTDRARFSIIAPHSFLSSRLAGMPGVRTQLLEEFGICLVTYDLPGFGESDPHPSRNLNSSAFDMLYLADAVGVDGKFWVLGYSSGAMHAWAALRFIPNRIAGAILVAPMINPYESSMTKEEMKRIWEKWVPRRKMMYFLARKFPEFLSYFYRRSFLSGKHDRVDKRLSLSLGRKDEIFIEGPTFEEFWYRDVEESVRQKNVKPLVEEAVLQVSSWGFNLIDLQVQKKCPRKGILPWLRSMYSHADCELAGFLGSIHIWQGTDDGVVPPSMTEYVSRVLPSAIVHKLPNEGHFSFFHFCDECHKQIFSTIFGVPRGPLDRKEEPETSLEENSGELESMTDLTTE